MTNILAWFYDYGMPTTLALVIVILFILIYYIKKLQWRSDRYFEMISTLNNRLVELEQKSKGDEHKNGNQGSSV